MTAQSGSSQTVTADRQYDAFGQVVSSSGTWNGAFGHRSEAKIPPSVAREMTEGNRGGGSFGYQSDADYGLQLLGHRYYDASTGRFLTRDPIKDGRNWYGYCDGNPITYSDPTGEARVNVYAYNVGGTIAMHVGIEVIDDRTGKRFYFAGGPERIEMYDPGQLVDWGTFGNGSDNYNEVHVEKTRRFYVCLVNDYTIDTRLYLNIFSDLSDRIKSKYRYSLVPEFFGGGNSNSWAGHLIDGAGLGSQLDNALEKKYGTGGALIIPGLHHFLE